MTKTVMIVDDSRVVLEEMKQFLDGTGFEIVQYCKDGESAIEAYGQVKPDIVTMDIVLPGIDGFEATKAILQQWPDAKIVIVSSLAYDETINQGKKLGAVSFVFKPLQKQELIGAFLEAI